ncbi:MAG: hypothetical protein DME65_02780 [Verrucomicrobia bacterium]|nr:MAG: hypothetical protein DME65_02780 [Verrucomicrobiota bacterium]
MAYVHQSGWTPASGQELKSCTTIDEDTIALFKSIVAEAADFYERHHVAALGKRLADEIKAVRELESIRRFEDRPAGRRWPYKRLRAFL